MDSGHGSKSLINLPAGILSAICTVLLLMGVQESKTVTNVFTVLKILLVLFMIVGGFMLWDYDENMKPFFDDLVKRSPESTGETIRNVMRGATSSFFGYLGYDEVCCIAGEAMNPNTNMPRSVIGTLLIVSVVYILASFALTGMQPSNLISSTSAFPKAFEYNQWYWASQLTKER